MARHRELCASLIGTSWRGDPSKALVVNQAGKGGSTLNLK